MSLAPTNRSGAPVSSTLMWADSVHTTACAGPTIVASDRTLAPEPPHTKSTSVPAPNRSRNTPVASAVHRSAP